MKLFSLKPSLMLQVKSNHLLLSAFNQSKSSATSLLLKAL